MHRIAIENDFEIQNPPNVWLYFNFQNKKISFWHVLFCNKFELDFNHAGENLTTQKSLLYVHTILYWINFEMLCCLLAKSSWSILMSTKFVQVMKKEILLTKPHLLCIDLKKTCKKKRRKVSKGPFDIWHIIKKTRYKYKNKTSYYFLFDFTARKIK